ncbi:MAG: hypothetical protein HY682_04880 [Chloroflexi bacterium]|nr:hypothetical protein [Chloroflexota bacterium]
MPDPTNKLFLYEALELRAEYDARIKTLRDCLPESRESRDRFSFARRDEGMYRPSPDFSVSEAREELRKMEVKRRKLNGAIQEANFERRIEFGGESMTLNEALEVRKGLNTRIGELHTQVVQAAYEHVIYKEGRDIVEPSELSYRESVERLDQARQSFRALNRAIRAATFETVIGFLDEP